MDICALSHDLVMDFRSRIPDISTNKGIDTPLKYKKVANPVIPLHIYQVWHNKQEMPPSVRKSVRHIKHTNPEFEHHLFDEKECRAFIVEHFPSIVVQVYDGLIPHAIKADLWRYCVMYKLGGVYLDSKYYGIHGFKFIYFTDKEYFCQDTERSMGGIYNALLICKPGNEKMLKCIYQLVDNWKNNYYGSIGACIGPLMVSRFFSVDEYKHIELKHIFLSVSDRYILYKDHRILKYAPNYDKERNQRNLKHWNEPWKARTLYKKTRKHKR